VVDALRCATEVQAGMADRNATVPADKRIEFRIGINVGDIVVEDGDIFGDGVSVAARLEGLAEAGGICVSARKCRDRCSRKSYHWSPGCARNPRQHEGPERANAACDEGEVCLDASKAVRVSVSGSLSPASIHSFLAAKAICRGPNRSKVRPWASKPPRIWRMSVSIRKFQWRGGGQIQHKTQTRGRTARPGRRRHHQ
jgi:hypothetical protein